MFTRNSNRSVLIGSLVFAIVLALHGAVTFVLADDRTRNAPSYHFITIDLPTSQGQFGFTTLADINEKGEITGGFTNSDLQPYGFLLDKRIKSTDIRCSKDVLSTEPQAINKHGEIAGSATVVTKSIRIPVPPFVLLITKSSGFFRGKDGTCIILDFPGADLTEAVGINDDGQVVGDYRDSNGKFHGFFWEAGLFLTLDATFPDATITAPTAINNANQIVGYYYDDKVEPLFPNGRIHGFFYDNGVFTAFDFPDSLGTLPADINDRGQILGIFQDAAFVSRSFLLQNGSFTVLDVPFPEIFATQVSGINNNGEIVGRYLQINPSDPVNPFLSRGFLAIPRNDLKLVTRNIFGDRRPESSR